MLSGRRVSLLGGAVGGGVEESFRAFLKGLGLSLVASELRLRILPPPWRVLRFSIIEY